MIHLTATTTVPRPVSAVWAVLADYERDPEWRAGVTTMAPSAPGPVAVGTTTAEVMRFGGRTYRNDGEVVAVEPEVSFRWRTTSGADAEGGRRVEAIDASTTRVTLEVHVRPHGSERILRPLLERMLRRQLHGDLDRFRRLLVGDAVVPMTA